MAVILCFLVFASFAQKEIKIDDAKNHVGDTVSVYTKIYGGKYLERDSLTLLNAGGYYPDAPLTIVIRAAARKQFDNPEEYYKGVEVCVTGKISLYKDKPQIEVTDKEQIMEQLKDHTDIRSNFHSQLAPHPAIRKNFK
ncbi:MAG: hypothetical protein ACRDE8_02540 [Ginsengibacter sp.]